MLVMLIVGGSAKLYRQRCRMIMTFRVVHSSTRLILEERDNWHAEKEKERERGRERERERSTLMRIK